MSHPVVLCVDDEKIVLDSLKEQLYSGLDGSFVIETAESGVEALEIVAELEQETQELAVVISDQIMPGIKGDELLTVVHTRSPRTLNILLTGQANAEDVGKAVNEAGLYRYISKPWQAPDLIMTVNGALRSYRQDKKLEEQNLVLQQTNRDLERLNQAYERFVPREFLRFLGRRSIVEVNLGDQVQAELTILFSDIRNFASLSEQMSPQENFNFINGYLNRISPSIRRHGGFIDKYIGDGIMALFPEQPQEAIQAAIDMQHEVTRYNHYRQSKDRQPITVGVGLHTGRVMMGTIGEVERMESTVISDAVNLAARLEGLTKMYGVSLLVSGSTLFGLDRPTQYNFRFLDRVKVKGKQEPVSVFEIFDGEPEEIIGLKLETRTFFEKGLLHYHGKELAEAGEHFTRVLEIYPQDQAARLYLKRVEQLATHGIPFDWTGVEAMVDK